MRLVLAKLMPSYQCTFQQQFYRIVKRCTAYTIVFVLHFYVQRLYVKMILGVVYFLKYSITLRCFPVSLVFKEFRKNIFLIFKETLANIIKHSKATTALVQMNFHESDLFITVEDNGVGFDTQQIQDGIGLKNINSRVRYLNAQLDIDSSENGTSFQINIDLNSLQK